MFFKSLKKKQIAMSYLFLLGMSLLLTTQLVSAFQPEVAEETKYKVVCTTSLLADFSSKILGEDIDSIIPPGVCPAHFDPSTTEVAALATADLVICHGFEGWLDALLTSANNTAAKRTINPLVGGKTWNVPTNAIDLYIPTLTNIFANKYPSDNSTFQTNAATYKTTIQNAMNSIQSTINSSANAGANVAVMSHQEYFARWLGLNVVVTWNASDEAMSAEDIAKVVSTASTNNVTIFISNNPSGVAVGADMAAELNATHIVMANFPGDENTTDYISMITQNANRIANAGQSETKDIGVSLIGWYLLSLFTGVIFASKHYKKRKYLHQ